jgi:protoporphyrinogen oxidase
LNKDVIVVGAGIAGIVASYLEVKKGNKVKLIDASKNAGGLLKSTFNGSRYFDYGTHVYSKTGIAALDEFLISSLSSENCIIEDTMINANFFHGKMSNISGHVNTSFLSKREYNLGCVDFINSSDNNKDNLEDYLISRFGATFYKLIFKDVVAKYMGIEAKELSPLVGSYFDMNRVLAFDDSAVKRLTKIGSYNDKLGHMVKEKGTQTFYPKEGGAGYVIDILMKKLDDLGVEFLPLSKIDNVIEVNGKVRGININGQNIKLDNLIWTLPHSFLTRLTKLELNSYNFPPVFRGVGLYDYTFNLPILSPAKYINIYDTSLKSGRITLYQNLTNSDNYSCTVESLFDTNSDIVSTDYILKELKEIGLVSDSNDCTYNESRYIQSGFPILTNEFAKNQKKLSNNCENYFKNVLFIGRSAGDSFLMNDVLKDVYNKVVN